MRFAGSSADRSQAKPLPQPGSSQSTSGPLREVRDPRETPLAREAVHRSEEALEGREGVLALDLQDVVAMAFAGTTPAVRHLRRVLAHVLLPHEPEAGLLDHLLGD